MPKVEVQIKIKEEDSAWQGKQSSLFLRDATNNELHGSTLQSPFPNYNQTTLPAKHDLQVQCLV